MVSDRLKRTILAQLDVEDWEIVDSTTAGMVPGWDSLSHIKIIIAIENEYKIRFQTKETIRLKNIGELQALIDRKTA